ncbi:MAG TPA: DUF3231 family protein [Candidatus Sulfotelmatobacter sp.]|nr:DUF3231 family protein [Candidatus Sulfotelmatobacter sp.]HWI62264.1 DUF3231 family protein [Symbiobacteriaceae bacterium]
MNILQSLFQTMQQPSTPPHVGEAFNAWAYYVSVKESRIIALMMLNHTNDLELKDMLEHFINDVLEPQAKQLTDFLRNEGIDMPAGTGDKAKANEQQIPPGAKMTDNEIANMVVVKLNGLLLFCFMGQFGALRDDISAMFYNFQTHVMAQSYNHKKLMQKRGWLLVPPYYYGSQRATS